MRVQTDMCECNAMVPVGAVSWRGTATDRGCMIWGARGSSMHSPFSEKHSFQKHFLSDFYFPRAVLSAE